MPAREGLRAVDQQVVDQVRAGNCAGFRYYNGKAIGWDAYNFPATINNSTSEYINFYYDGNHARWKSVYVNGTTTETTINVGDLKGWIWRKVVKALRCLRWAESDIGWC